MLVGHGPCASAILNSVVGDDGLNFSLRCSMAANRWQVGRPGAVTVFSVRVSSWTDQHVVVREHTRRGAVSRRAVAAEQETLRRYTMNTARIIAIINIYNRWAFFKDGIDILGIKHELDLGIDRLDLHTKRVLVKDLIEGAPPQGSLRYGGSSSTTNMLGTKVKLLDDPVCLPAVSMDLLSRHRSTEASISPRWTSFLFPNRFQYVSYLNFLMVVVVFAHDHGVVVMEPLRCI